MAAVAANAGRPARRGRRFALMSSACIDYVPCMSMLPRVTILRAAAASGAVVAFALAVAPGARAAATGPAGHPVRGLDISAYQHTGAPIHWRMLSRQGIRFVAIKVSEGTYY